MALIQCIECGKEISSRAEHCPYCGIPLKVMIGSPMPQPEQQIVLTKQSAPQPEESEQQYQQTQPSPQPEESEQQYQQTQPSPQPEESVQQYPQTQPSPQSQPEQFVQQYQQPQQGQFVQQYQQTQPSPQPQPGQFVQQYQYTQQRPQQKPAKRPISFTQPAITLVICTVLRLICSFADATDGGMGAIISALGGLSATVGFLAFLLIIIRAVEYGYRKLKK